MSGAGRTDAVRVEPPTRSDRGDIPGLKMVRHCMRRLAVIVMLLCGAVAAEEEAAESDAEALEVPGTLDCVSLARIDRTRVVNDSTILFYMLGPDVYVNNLPRRCNGLKRTDAFSYETSIGRLCNVDIIRGLRNFGGQFVPGVACGLGKFVPITQEQIDMLLAEPELEPEAVEPELESIEPELEDPEPAAGDAAAD